MDSFFFWFQIDRKDVEIRDKLMRTDPDCLPIIRTVKIIAQSNNPPAATLTLSIPLHGIIPKDRRVHIVVRAPRIQSGSRG